MYKFYVKLAKIYSRILNRNILVQTQTHVEVSSQKISNIKETLDVLFITPSNNTELGGKSSAYKLITGLATNNLKIKVHPLNLNPTIIKSGLEINLSDLLTTKYRVIVMCARKLQLFVLIGIY